jgi:hypothetical protein
LRKVEGFEMDEYGVEVHYCEPKEGSILGEDNDEDDGERIDGNLI